MQIFASNEVHARSRFWYFLHQYKKMKKETGEILMVNELHEKSPSVIKNFAIWIRYNSRSGTHNMYKEYRDVTLCGAVKQMYSEMAGSHSAREKSIQIIRTAVVPASQCRRAPTKQFHNSKISFPLTQIRKRDASKSFKSTFKGIRPNTYTG